MLLFVFGFVIILGRLFWVQVVDHTRYREVAKRQYESKVELRAERGSFFDRKNREIVGMIRTTSFAADPTVVEQPALIAQLLAGATGVSDNEYLAKLRTKGRRFVWLARGVNTALFPDLDILKDPGLIRVTEPKRNYLYGTVGAQLLGSTDVDNNGVTGLELQYDHALRGRPGFVIMQRDGRGRLRTGVNPERRSPQNGNNLTLTIDIEFQKVVEQELARGVAESGALSGTIVAMEPTTGYILAMASYPSYDPLRLDLTTNDALRIRAITDQYEPGSTVKAITAAALIQEGKLGPSDTVNMHGGTLHLGPYVIRDDHPMRQSTLQSALEQSSNVAFASSVQLLDDRVFYKYFRDFGFGIPTGIDIRGEVRGLLKKPTQFAFGTKNYMAHGYGLSCTALQILNAYATIANGGQMMEPRCVQRITDPAGKVVARFEPQKVRRVISEETAKKVTQMLIGAVERGTGVKAAIPGLSIAGKTGTSKQLILGSYEQTSAYTASFVGFYPAQRPQIAMIVLLDKPTTSIYGGTTAAPIFRRIVQKSLSMITLNPTEQQSLAASAAADSVVVPDIRGLRPSTADTILAKLGLRLADKSDNGIVLHQAPSAGTSVERGQVIQIRITPHQKKAHPDVRGMVLRRAISILHDAGYEVRVRGSGIVQEQHWTGDTCTLHASSSKP